MGGMRGEKHYASTFMGGVGGGVKQGNVKKRYAKIPWEGLGEKNSTKVHTWSASEGGCKAREFKNSFLKRICGRDSGKRIHTEPYM